MRPRPRLRGALAIALLVLLTAGLAALRPSVWVSLAAIGAGLFAMQRLSGSSRLPTIAAGTWAVATMAFPHQAATGYARFYVDQTYHHQVLRALNHAAAGGADVTEVLEATRDVEAGDAQGWYSAWTALGDRNLARARATADRPSRGRALLRAHTYHLRAQFFLPPDDPKRPDSSARDRRAFYEGLDTLGVAYERIAVPFDGWHLNALYYPAGAGARAPLLLFCGGSDTTLEELYFFLVAAAHERGYAVLAFEGPGQGSVLRDQGLTMTSRWEIPTKAVLDTFLASHPRPAKIVAVGLSLGGYLAARAAAFEDRVDGLVAYDVFFDGAEVARGILPPPARGLLDVHLGGVVDLLGPVVARFDPKAASGLVVGGSIFRKTRVTEIVDSLSEYRLEPVAARIHQDVLALAGETDQFVPRAQVESFQRSLVNARTVTVKVYDRASGGAEHSQLGATSLWQADLFDWLEDKFGDTRP